jgi:Rod binding domain-containing protein
MMFDQKVAEDLATKGGGIGLQKMLSGQLRAYNKPESGS